MRLLVPTRICLALRWATTPAASSDVKRAPMKKSKSAAALREKTAQLDAPPAASEVVTPTSRLSDKEAAAAKLRIFYSPTQTAQLGALAYLDAGKNEEFRTQWKGKLLGGEMPFLTTLHDALLKSAENGKSDPAMLRWYAESLVNERRNPFPAKPHFESLMGPVVRALGGKFEKWEEDDKRKEKLRKWRDEYEDGDLENLLDSMLDFMTNRTEEKKFTAGNLVILERVLERVKRQERIVAINWSDIEYRGAASRMNFDNLLPGCSLVQVAREADTNYLQFYPFELRPTPHAKAENDKHPLMKNPYKLKRTRKFDGLCTLMLAVASRGHWLINLNVDDYMDAIVAYLKYTLGDPSKAKLLKKFANDSVLRFTSAGVVQPAVDHSRAPQFIDQEKKELAFTVARDEGRVSKRHYNKSIEYYSLHLD